MKAAIVIPAFNEAAVISGVLKSIPKKIAGVKLTMIVVNDGSTDETAKEVAKTRAILLTHTLNRGVGAATKTGMDYATKLNADIIVTFDADGQHQPSDIEKIIAPVLSQRADLVIGSRLLKVQKMPADRFLINWLANIITFLLFGVFSTDSQSGLRAFSQKAASLIDFKGERMDFSSEILLEAKKHNLKVIEVPTSAIYTNYSRTKGQKNINAIPTLIRLLVKFLR